VRQLIGAQLRAEALRQLVESSPTEAIPYLEGGRATGKLAICFQAGTHPRLRRRFF
jgi:hypothetical protein